MAEGQSSYLIKEGIDKDNAMKLNAELLCELNYIADSEIAEFRRQEGLWPSAVPR
ncbi:hypothetical protein [Mediterranea sp. An20]|uniref:hypothetical protein n=1 Tax=Mediterranea sp. An20 TaxID=1965586 RepID=UPI0013A64A2B|nr:hypothetical protein [Mediterranea sp. An20]